jgi:hypothetical protein
MRARSLKTSKPVPGVSQKTPLRSGLAGLGVNRVDEALGLVVHPGQVPTPDIVNKVKGIVAEMTPWEAAQFRERLRQINEASHPVSLEELCD